MLPPQSSFNSCSRRWARVIRRVGHHGPRCYSISSSHRLGHSLIFPTSRLSSWVMWCSLEGIHSWPVLKSQATSNSRTTCELFLRPTPHCLRVKSLLWQRNRLNEGGDLQFFRKEGPQFLPLLQDSRATLPRQDQVLTKPGLITHANLCQCPLLG